MGTSSWELERGLLSLLCCVWSNGDSRSDSLRDDDSEVGLVAPLFNRVEDWMWMVALSLVEALTSSTTPRVLAMP